MIKSVEDLKEYLDYEYKKYFKHENKFKVWICTKLELGEKYIIWKFQKNLRRLEYSINNKQLASSFFRKLILSRLSNKYGLHILPNTFDIGLKIMHLGSILVNENVKVGKNCSIHINTALVAGGTSSEAPLLGDNIVIGIGAILIGGIKIGNNCAIGAGAVVNKSFDDNNTIAGVPAKIISNKGSDSWKNRENK